MAHSTDFSIRTPIVVKAGVVLMVISAHVVVLTGWNNTDNQVIAVSPEISISFTVSPNQSPSVKAEHRKNVPQQVLETTPVAIPRSIPVSVDEAVQVAPVAQVAEAVTPSVSSATQEVTITEPDYRGAYLNNPPPSYPMTARRMGMQGKVILNVEVLANGNCGQINVDKSSGYTVLDNSAIQTVKSWRFSPATQAGRAVDKWFKIPVQFSLKDRIS